MRLSWRFPCDGHRQGKLGRADGAATELGWRGGLAAVLAVLRDSGLDPLSKGTIHGKQMVLMLCAECQGKRMVLTVHEPRPLTQAAWGCGGVGEGFLEEVTPEWSFDGQRSFHVWRVMGRREGEIVEVEEGLEA